MKIVLFEIRPISSAIKLQNANHPSSHNYNSWVLYPQQKRNYKTEFKNRIEPRFPQWASILTNSWSHFGLTRTRIPRACTLPSPMIAAVSSCCVLELCSSSIWVSEMSPSISLSPLCIPPVSSCIGLGKWAGPTVGVDKVCVYYHFLFCV